MHFLRIDAVEVDKALQRRLQRRQVIVTHIRGMGGAQERHQRRARREESGRAHHHDAEGPRLVQQAVGVVVEVVEKRIVGCVEGPERRRCNRFPEVTQPLDAVLRRVARNDCGVDGANRDARHPVRSYLGLVKCLVDARLIGTQRTPALQQQCNTFKWKAMTELARHDILLSGRTAGIGGRQTRRRHTERIHAPSITPG